MKQKILLIDDDDLVIRSLRKLLSAKGYEVESAVNALEAVTLAANQDFDLVVSDVRMPGESGITAIEKIQALYGERRISCGYILISGYSEENTPEQTARLGINTFLNKPFDNEAFLKHVQEELKIAASEKEMKKATLDFPAISQPKKPEPPKKNN